MLRKNPETICIFVLCLYFSKSTFFRKFLSGMQSVSNSLEPDQARHCVGPVLAPNCLQRLSGAQWLSGRVLDLRPRGRGFEPHRRHCVVSLSKNINPSLVLVQPRKTRPFITERLLMRHKESNQTKKGYQQTTLTCILQPSGGLI